VSTQGLLFYGVLPERSETPGATPFQRGWRAALDDEAIRSDMEAFIKGLGSSFGALEVLFGAYGLCRARYTEYPYLAIKEACFTNEGDFAETLPSLAIGAGWDERLREACRQLDVKARAPAWHLALLGDW
jgi:hypothetical protein